MQSPDPKDLRDAARTVVQAVWAMVVAVGAVVGLDVPAEVAPPVVAVAVPALAGVLAYAANEWDDADERWKRRVARALSIVARDEGR